MVPLAQPLGVHASKTQKLVPSQDKQGQVVAARQNSHKITTQ